MTNQIVSIVMPVYNAQRYIRESLNAIVNQTYKHLEIICVDDGSTDESPAILDEYSKKDKRIKVVRQKNQFAGIARNNGLDHATGDYIMFIDSDDILERNAVNYLIHEAVKNNTDVIVYGFYIFTDNVKKRRPTRNKYKSGMLCSSYDIRETVFQITRSLPWDKFIRTDFLRKTGLRYQNMRVSEDIFVNRTMMTEAERILFSGKRLINYRIDNPNSLQGKMNNYPAEFLKGNLAIADELERLGTSELYKSSFEKMILSDALMHLRAIDSYDNYATIIESMMKCDYWAVFKIDKQNAFIVQSEYRKTLECLMDGKKDECLANLYIESKRTSIDRHSAEYKIGHKILKLLRLTY